MVDVVCVIVQSVPSGFWVLAHPVMGLQAPLWQSSVEHVTTAPPVHTPPWHFSPVVQAFESSQVVPFGCVGFEQPVNGLQVPARWHWSSAVQVTVVPVHTPARHWSPVVQALLSLQDA